MTMRGGTFLKFQNMPIKVLSPCASINNTPSLWASSKEKREQPLLLFVYFLGGGGWLTDLLSD
jgi:hypothetical protein